MKQFILIFPALLMILILSGANCNNSNGGGNNSTQTSSNQSQTAGTNTSDQAEYFSDDAKVMLFYSEYCGWCIKQKDVLRELAPEGYKVKPMNVGENQDLWKQYNIEGTPTFIAPDGTKLVGYQDKDKLKAFLDKYK